MSRFMSPYDREFEELSKSRRESYQLGYKAGKKETLDKMSEVIESKTNGLIWKQQVINEIMSVINELRTEGEEGFYL